MQNTEYKYYEIRTCIKMFTLYILKNKNELYINVFQVYFTICLYMYTYLFSLFVFYSNEETHASSDRGLYK